MDENNIPNLVSVPEAAKRAGVARNTILLAEKNGKIKAIKPSRHYLIFADDLDRWKEEDYQPNKAQRYPISDDKDNNSDKSD